MGIGPSWRYASIRRNGFHHRPGRPDCRHLSLLRQAALSQARVEPLPMITMSYSSVEAFFGDWRLQMTDNTSTALITGGTSGIGLATAKKLAQLGIHVLVVGRNAERGKKAVDEIRASGGKADFIGSELQGADSGSRAARRPGARGASSNR